MGMTKQIGRLASITAASLVAAAAFTFAHDPAKKSAEMDDMMCGGHHSAAMKASQQLSMHLTEAKRSGTMPAMRRHVEAAEKSMAEMEKHMSACMKMMDEMHGGMMGGGMGGMTSGEKKAATRIVDPVCNMEVDAKTAPSVVYKGQTYYFCSEKDKAKFEKNPEQYASKKS
jgi:YHS domain-containing protein